MLINLANYVQVYLIASLVLLLFGCGPDALKLTIENEGHTSIDSLQIRVTGNSYSISSLSPGDTELAEIDVTGESNIELLYNDTTHLIDLS